jgi:hypothetical protein
MLFAFRFSLFQTRKTYKHHNVIFQFLIRSEIPTFYQVLLVSHILYYTARFLSKPRTHQRGVRVIIFHSKTKWQKVHSTECSSLK